MTFVGWRVVNECKEQKNGRFFKNFKFQLTSIWPLGSLKFQKKVIIDTFLLQLIQFEENGSMGSFYSATKSEK